MKLRFSAVYCTGQDEDYPVHELNVHSENTRGWQSSRFCEFPQELGFELEGGEKRITQVQILSHQSKIATKIEIFVGWGSDYHSATFKRLGYLSLDSNERSQFQARELKTVYVDCVGSFVRLMIHSCYLNKLNVYNQIGIIALNLLGTDDIPAEKVPNRPVRAERQDSKQSGGGDALKDLSKDKHFDEFTSAKLQALSEAKSTALANEDYKLAKKLKAVETELKAIGIQISDLEISKREAVEDEDYDKAEEIKAHADALRAEVQKKISEVDIPGLSEPKRITANLVGGNFSGGGGAKQIAKPKAVERQSPPKVIKGGVVDVDDLPATSSAYRGVAETSDEVESHTPVDHTKLYKDAVNMDWGPDDVPSNVRPSSSSKAKKVSGPSAGGLLFEALKGVENIGDLPDPDELPAGMEAADNLGIVSLLGTVRAKCLFSKAWSLREAVIQKIRLMLPSLEKDPGMHNAAIPLAAIIKEGVGDKIAQVMTMSVTLLEEFLVLVKKAKLARAVISPTMEESISILAEKMADGNARVRESCMSGLEAILKSSSVGPLPVSGPAFKTLTAKQKGIWRVVLTRLELISMMIDLHGFSPTLGLAPEFVMNFIKSSNGFTHSNNEVRDAAKALTVAVYMEIGETAIAPFLKELRPKQREEYEAAFKEGVRPSKKKDKAEVAVHSPRGGENHSPTKAKASSNAAKGGGGGGGSKSNGKEKESKSHGKEAQEAKGGEDFSVCMFCGAGDTKWDEDALDLHYWRDCPLLAACPGCTQIVEIASLPDHQLDECDQKNSYVPCDVTGLAVKSSELKKWATSEYCQPPPDGCMYCPLCLAAVDDTDEDWKDHLMKTCIKNPRIKK